MMNLTGGPWDFMIVFASGVLLSFTPCVYPVMPLTAGCIAGANMNGSRWRGFFLSLIYVLGLALVYCLLAVAAALTGKIFGQFQNQPIVHGVIGGLLLFFALAMFDVVSLPHLGFQVKASSRPRNFFTVFLLGAVSGLVVGPCAAPVLGTLLVYIGSRQNLLYGIFLMFVFSYGIGFSLILVGTFSGLLSAIPKSGVWMVWVKRVCAAVILIVALIFLLKAMGVR